ncbi:hypothetical protein LCGC14_0589810 [marine sediment metagenome]|uniref:Uncharacterized protein n=2 Tax=root TaxID=1 RepID=A0A9C9NFG1_9HYPH|nr:hypothetical protein [Aurantimonas coralicida]
MPRIFQLPPDVGSQIVLDYAARLREEQLRREQEQAQERTFDFAGFLGGGLIGAFPTRGEVKGQGGLERFGAGFGKVLPFAGAAVGGAVGGPAGAGFGAQLGGQIGSVFASGDVARQDIAGFTSAAKAASGLIQARDDQRLYGGPVTAQDRALYTRAALKVRTSLSKLKDIAAQTGQFIPEIIHGLGIEQENTEQFGERLAKLGFPGTAQDADALVQQGAYPNRMAVLQAAQGEQAEREVQTAAQKTYANRLANLRGEQDFFAQQAGNMKRQAVPRDVNERDHRIEDVDGAFRNGDMNAQQAIERIDAIMADKPRLTYRPVEPTVQDEWGKNFAIVQRPMPDGSLSRPFMVRRGRRTPENPTGEMHMEGWIGGKGKGMDLDFGTYYRGLTPAQRQASYRDTFNELFLTRQKGQPDPGPPEVYKAMEAKYDIFGELYPVEPGGAPAAQGGPPGQAAQVPPAQRATQAFGALLQRVNQKPIDTWSEQELVLAGDTIDAIVLDIERSGTRDPNLLAILAQVLEFSDVINAQRNR